MKIYVNNRQTTVRLDAKMIREIAKQSIALETFICDEVTIHFVTKLRICRLHEEFFNDPSITDCITFPLDTDADTRRVAGDVFVCPTQAIHYVAVHGGDVLTETILYVIHGLLHLMGYDDLTLEARRVMRKAEKRHLAAAEPLIRRYRLGFNDTVL